MRGIKYCFKSPRSTSGPNSSKASCPEAYPAAKGEKISLAWKVLPSEGMIQSVFSSKKALCAPPTVAQAKFNKPLSGPIITPHSVSIPIAFLSVPTPGSTTPSKTPCGIY